MKIKMQLTTFLLPLLFSLNSWGSEDLKLYVFDCGTVQVDSMYLFTNQLKDLFRSSTLNNTCYLLKKGEVELLWDTGIDDNLLNKAESSWKSAWLLSLSVQKTLVSQLEEINIKPEDIEFVALSHFHTDHAGNLELFKNAKLLIQENEFNAAFGDDHDSYHFDLSQYDDFPKENIIKITSGEYDVFGDNKVRIIPSPGHSPGHQILLINLPRQEQPILLSGDLYHLEESYQNNYVPGFNHDHDQTLGSMATATSIISAYDADLWIQHDPTKYQELKLSPEYYQ